MAETPAEKARIIPHTPEGALLVEVVALLRLMQADLAVIRTRCEKSAPVLPSQPGAAKPKHTRAPRKAKAVQV